MPCVDIRLYVQCCKSCHVAFDFVRSLAELYVFAVGEVEIPGVPGATVEL